MLCLRLGLIGLCLVAPLAAGPIVSVRDYGALGDGVADDTAAIQAAVDAVAGQSGIVDIPDGTYRINAVQGVHLKSQTTLQLAPQATLQAIPNALEHSHILRVRDVEQVRITGGILEGDRDHHLGQTGEWGHGIDIRHSKEVTVEKLTVRRCWGDGIYVGGDSSQITIDHVTADRNRRQGLSITSGVQIEVRDSLFQRTQGTAPECGIDIEPNTKETVSQCQILRCQFLDNAGGGLQVGPANADRGQAFVNEFVAEGNIFERNGSSDPPHYAIQILHCEGAVVRNNFLRANRGIGIGIVSCSRVQVLKNQITGTRWTGNKSDAGILISEDTASVVRDNTVLNNEGYGIFMWKSSVDLRKNKVYENAKGNRN